MGFWRSASSFAASYKACLCEICTVPSLYRPSTDGLICTTTRGQAECIYVYQPGHEEGVL